MTDERPRIPIRDKRFSSDQPSAPETPPATPEEESEATPPSDGAGQVDELRKLADERLDQLMRMKADFENFRKREIREKTELVERASLRIVERLLPVLDDLERAIGAATKHAEQHDGAEAIVKGVDLVRKQLHDVLTSEGLEQLETEGAFDPELHEAVSTMPGDVTEPTVLEVVRPGYKLKGKTIRPALVQVSVPSDGAGGTGGTG